CPRATVECSTRATFASMVRICSSRREWARTIRPCGCTVSRRFSSSTSAAGETRRSCFFGALADLHRTSQDMVFLPGSGRRRSPARRRPAPRSLDHAFLRARLGRGAFARACAAARAVLNVAASIARNSQRVQPMRPQPPATGAMACCASSQNRFCSAAASMKFKSSPLSASVAKVRRGVRNAMRSKCGYSLVLSNDRASSLARFAVTGMRPESITFSGPTDARPPARQHTRPRTARAAMCAAGSWAPPPETNQRWATRHEWPHLGFPLTSLDGGWNHFVAARSFAAAFDAGQAVFGLDDFELDAAVLFPRGGVRGGIERAVLTVALRDEAVGLHAARLECIHDSCRAQTSEVQVVSVGVALIGVAGHLEHGELGMPFERRG